MGCEQGRVEESSRSKGSKGTGLKLEQVGRDVKDNSVSFA